MGSTVGSLSRKAYPAYKGFVSVVLLCESPLGEMFHMGRFAVLDLIAIVPTPSILGKDRMLAKGLSTLLSPYSIVYVIRNVGYFC